MRHLAARPAVSATYLAGEELAVTVHGRAELFELADPARGELRQAMLDHYLPLQGPEFETWLDDLDGVAARIAAEKMFIFACPADRPPAPRAPVAALPPARGKPEPVRCGTVRRRLGGNGYSRGEADGVSTPNGDGPPGQDRPSGLAGGGGVYLVMMGGCVLLIVLAWTLIWRYSVTAAVVMSAVALVVPPVAAIVANAGPVNRQ